MEKGIRTGYLSDGTPALGPDVLLTGFGIERNLKTGTLYTGFFLNGQWHGRGALSRLDALKLRVTCDGTWEHGQRQGRGVETVTESKLSCAGSWENGSKHGAFRCLVNETAWRAEGWSNGVRMRERVVPAGAPGGADAWRVEPGVRFAVAANAEDKWVYRGDVLEQAATLTAHGVGFSLSEQAELLASEGASTVGRWSYYGGWRNGERHGPGHLIFPDMSFFVGDLSECVPRHGFFGLPNGSALHGNWTDAAYQDNLCKSALCPLWLLPYKCGCGCEGCICAAEPTVADDAGRDVTLGELCQRLEKNLQAFGDLSRVEARPEELATMRIPCPCEDSSCG